ncbi:MAG: VWA domain-containing protein, partial [Myxococcales bacterium]
GMSDADFQQLLERLAELMKDMDPELSDLARALVLQDTGALERLLREMMESGTIPAVDSPTQMPAAIRAMMDRLGAQGLAEELDRLSEAARQAGADEEAMARLDEYLEQRLKDLGEMLKGTVKIENEQRDKPEERKQERDRLLDKSFYYLSPSEIKRMREAVSALARKLKNLMSIRRKRMKRGRLDVKGTLRASMEYGGVPFRVRYENKRKERPQVIILCDISDSVRNVSRFMLQFVHSLQDLYSRVRSYVFVADIAEVTRLFKENDIQTGITEAINGNVVNVYAHSDFGRAFRDFHRDHLEAVDSRTTVIILGDARNNYNAPNDWVLRDVQQRAKQVIWLNPENRSTWGFGDSEMSKYARYCDMVEECRNLRQLYAVVDRIVLT